MGSPNLRCRAGQPDQPEGGTAGALALVYRVDRQRPAGVQEFLRGADVAEADLMADALLIYAAVIGFESLRQTTGTELASTLRRLATGRVG